jgi:hypothetical protein
MSADYKNEKEIAEREQEMIASDREHITELTKEINKEKDVEQ